MSRHLQSSPIADPSWARSLLALASVMVPCLSMLLPVAGWAEGGVRLLECSVVRVCDAAGSCAEGSARVSFRMEPEEITTDGSGRYTLRYAEIETAMEARSAAGPFLWNIGNERDTLLASSDTEFLWHRLMLEPTPSAVIEFLTCAFRQ